ncbi:MAG: hypothetical protein ABR569_06295 [Gaiellaceae bacterium]
MSRLRRRPSPALVVACLALAAALGGTGYSAIILPANSVGTKQLKNSSVVAAKVKVHSLIASNFKPGQLPAGPKGADGLAGAAGPAGPKGDSATKLFATVKQKAGGGDVELGPSSGVQTLVRQGGDSGIYNLKFNQDVSNCAVLAMPGGKSLVNGEATANTTGGSGVTVQTFDSGGSTADLDSFTVAVFC